MLSLEGTQPFALTERPAPVRPTMYDRYVHGLSPASFAYAVLTGLVTRSVGRSIQSLLLVNARPALIGKEAADTGASARVLRAGVTVVGTRPQRTIRRPDVLLVAGARCLTDGFEPAGIVPLDSRHDVSTITSLAAGVAAAAGANWGGFFGTTNGEPCSDGEFDGGARDARSRLKTNRRRLPTVYSDKLIIFRKRGPSGTLGLQAKDCIAPPAATSRQTA